MTADKKTLFRTKHFTYRQLYLSHGYLSSLMVSREMESCMQRAMVSMTVLHKQRRIKGDSNLVLLCLTIILLQLLFPFTEGTYGASRNWGGVGKQVTYRVQHHESHLWEIPQSKTGTGNNKTASQKGWWLQLPVILQADGEIYDLQWDPQPAQVNLSLAAINPNFNSSQALNNSLIWTGASQALYSISYYKSFLLKDISSTNPAFVYHVWTCSSRNNKYGSGKL